MKTPTAERSRKYRQRHRGRAEQSALKWIAKNPEKHRAHRIIYGAVKRGLVKRQPCAVCGNARSEAHHEDYTKPLKVIWFCRLHHRKKHQSH